MMAWTSDIQILTPQLLRFTSRGFRSILSTIWKELVCAVGIGPRCRPRKRNHDWRLLKRTKVLRRRSGDRSVNNGISEPALTSASPKGRNSIGNAPEAFPSAVFAAKTAGIENHDDGLIRPLGTRHHSGDRGVISQAVWPPRGHPLSHKVHQLDTISAPDFVRVQFQRFKGYHAPRNPYRRAVSRQHRKMC